MIMRTGLTISHSSLAHTMEFYPWHSSQNHIRCESPLPAVTRVPVPSWSKPLSTWGAWFFQAKGRHAICKWLPAARPGMVSFAYACLHWLLVGRLHMLLWWESHQGLVSLALFSLYVCLCECECVCVCVWLCDYVSVYVYACFSVCECLCVSMCKCVWVQILVANVMVLGGDRVFKRWNLVGKC